NEGDESWSSPERARHRSTGGRKHGNQDRSTGGARQRAGPKSQAKPPKPKIYSSFHMPINHPIFPQHSLDFIILCQPTFCTLSTPLAQPPLFAPVTTTT